MIGIAFKNGQTPVKETDNFLSSPAPIPIDDKDDDGKKKLNKYKNKIIELNTRRSAITDDHSERSHIIHDPTKNTGSQSKEEDPFLTNVNETIKGLEQRLKLRNDLLTQYHEERHRIIAEARANALAPLAGIVINFESQLKGLRDFILNHKDSTKNIDKERVDIAWKGIAAIGDLKEAWKNQTNLEKKFEALRVFQVKIDKFKQENHLKVAAHNENAGILSRVFNSSLGKYFEPNKPLQAALGVVQKFKTLDDIQKTPDCRQALVALAMQAPKIPDQAQGLESITQTNRH